MQANILKQFRSFIDFKCPQCLGKLRWAYIEPPLLCCLKCDIAWELHWRKSKQTIKQIKEDGWLKEKVLE